VAHNGSLLGLWLVKSRDRDEPLLARVHEELFVLAFSSAPRAHACSTAFGAEGAPFYVCSANVESVVRVARAAGVRGFIVDYDAERARFASAHPLPVGGGGARELR
jgi:hypothetical protein